MKKFGKKQFTATEELGFFEDVFFKHYTNEETEMVERGPVQWNSVFITLAVVIGIAIFLFA